MHNIIEPIKFLGTHTASAFAVSIPVGMDIENSQSFGCEPVKHLVQNGLDPMFVSTLVKK